MDVIATDLDRAYEADLVPKFLNKMDRDNEIERLEYFLSLLGPFPLPPHHLRMHVGTRPYASKLLNQGYRSSAAVVRTFGETPSGPVLDWGCGCGRTLWWLARHPGWREAYRGVDVDAEAIDWLREQGVGGVEVCGQMPERSFPFEDGSLHGAFSFSVLTHIHPARHRTWLQEVARVLRPGARIYLTFNGDRIVGEAAAREDLRPYAEHFVREGWSWREHPGHYKDAAFVSHERMRAAAEGLFESIELEARGYNEHMDVLTAIRA